MSNIANLAQTVGFKKVGKRKIAEPSKVKTLPIIDNSIINQPTIKTSIDCYVSGSYIQSDGSSIEVTQRYTIWVVYSESTQLQTMNQVRDKILNDFKDRYGGSFNVTQVHVQELPVPKPDPEYASRKAQELQFYGGSSSFRRMTRAERMRYEISGQQVQARINIASIRDRYKYPTSINDRRKKYPTSLSRGGRR